MRLNKFLAHAGVCSRRQADTAIEQGRVQVNGKPAMELGTQIDPESDQVTFDGRDIELPQGTKTYIVLNKPRGVVSTLSDPHARKKVSDFMPKRLGRLFPVGRLDKDSQGLLLMTNDGELAHRLTHPSFEIEKEYMVSLERPLRAPELRLLREGEVLLKDGTKAAPVKVIDAPKSRTGNPRYYFILREGKNREIRELMESLGVPLKRLKRLRIGPILIGPVAPGEWRLLTAEEEKALAALERGAGPVAPPTPEKIAQAKEESTRPARVPGRSKRGKPPRKPRPAGPPKGARSTAKKAEKAPRGRRGASRGAPKISRAKNVKGARRKR